ncbi:hypothetical protein NX781_07335 [Lactobacillus kullabergensis]|uniref:hypothetical protein n=1 Tax=Lactobacillus kullabergensis TaxID=1218493 RepID=UPI002247EDB8|nr:hypothetical protein [Lactobacillus kullabergensis]MCX0291604.1 hypothetical protein [Lactobacillus kullabergensis]
MNDEQFAKLRKILDFFKKQAPTAIIAEKVNSVENYKAESVAEYNRAKSYLGENNNSFKSFHVSVASAKDFLRLLNLLGAIHANFNIRSKPFIIEGEENSKSLKKENDYYNNWMECFSNYEFMIVNFDEKALDQDQYYG